jgi:hypothetical protein
MQRAIATPAALYLAAIGCHVAALCPEYDDNMRHIPTTQEAAIVPGIEPAASALPADDSSGTVPASEGEPAADALPPSQLASYFHNTRNRFSDIAGGACACLCPCPSTWMVYVARNLLI